MFEGQTGLKKWNVTYYDYASNAIDDSEHGKTHDILSTSTLFNNHHNRLVSQFSTEK